MHGISVAWVNFSDTDTDTDTDTALGRTTGAPILDRRSATFATLPAIVIATNDNDRNWSSICDVALNETDFQRFAGELTQSIAANPFAATTLAILLRGSGSRSIEEGLITESTTYSLLQGGPEFSHWLAGRGEKPVAQSTDAAVLVELVDGTLQISLNRPDRHNAFSRSMRDALVGALMISLDEGTMRVLLTGRGKSFCSGGDLAEFGTFASTIESHLTRLTRSPAWLMAQLASRTTACIHGASFGAGIELPAFAHDVAAAPDTRFCLPEISLGLIPGAGGTVSLPRRIGRHRTALLGLSGSVIDTATALAWGLIDRIV